MRNLFLILISVCYASLSWAQDSTRQEKKGIISTVHEKLNSSTTNVNQSTDSLKHKLSAKTLHHAADSLTQSKWNAKAASQKYDSLQQILGSQNKLTTVTDTVTKRITKPSDKLKQGADSLQHKADNYLQAKLDSVEQKFNKPLDKLNSNISSIEKPVEQKVEGVKQTIDQKTDKLQTNVQNATDGTVKAPIKDLNITNVDLPSKQGSVPDAAISNSNLPGLNTDLTGVTVPKGSTESLRLPDTKLNVDQLKDKANLKIPEADKVKNIQGEIGQVDSKLAEAEQYGKELQGLKKMDSASVESAVKKAEDKLAEMDELKGLEEAKKLEEKKLTLTKQQLEYNTMLQRYQDKKLLKDEIARKSRNVVNGKINKLTPAFKEAQEKIAKAKKINSNVEKFDDGKLKRENEMADKPFKERLVPGITLQVYNKQVFTIDWGVQLGYKLSNRLLMGVGGIYRIEVSENYSSWVKSSGIYGYRTYANFNLVKGFYVHGEFESLHLDSFVHPQTQMEVSSLQTYSGYFGIGKKYDISKKIRGSAIILYRAEFEGDLPSMSKINVRIGFDYNTKKRTKVGNARSKVK